MRSRYLAMLGLERQRKVKTLAELLTESDHEPIADNGNGKAEAVRNEQRSTPIVRCPVAND
jgi:hypothetical protein